MWIARELIRLFVRVGIAFAVALAFAAFWAAVGSHGFRSDLRTTCLAVGCLALLLGGIGRGSNFERAMGYSPTEQFWGRIPGLSTLQARGEDRSLTRGAVFFLTGAALLALALLVL